MNAYAPPFVPRAKTAFPLNFRLMVLLILVGTTLLAFIFNQETVLIVIVGLILLLTGYLFLYSRFLLWVFRGGLPRTDSALRWMPNNNYLLTIKSALLFQVGQVDEADRISRQALSHTNRYNYSQVDLQLNNLGYSLAMAGRYEEALPILEAAIRISPGFSSSYDSLAAWYLEQNLDPERALELSEIATELTEVNDDESRAVQQATCARALALTGRDTRAEAMLGQALSALNRASISTQAEINRQAGYVRLAQGNQTAAREYFEQAAKLEPDRMAGKLAKQALENMASIH